MIANLTIEDFAAHLNRPFTIEPAGEAAPLAAELIEVSALPAGRANGRQPFSIVLRCESERVLPQRIYRVTREELGTLELFLVPIGPDGEGLRYEALFN